MGYDAEEGEGWTSGGRRPRDTKKCVDSLSLSAVGWLRQLAGGSPERPGLQPIHPWTSADSRDPAWASRGCDESLSAGRQQA